jgi:succinate dehydrogenase / fumarate reductase flavoprotein subunit
MSESTKKRLFKTYETDVVILGGGVAAMFAARNILQHGKSAIMLDKGPLGHSGTSGVNWGTNMSDSFEKIENIEENMKQFVSGYIMNRDGMPSQQYIASLIRASKDAKAFEFAQQIGSVLERKASDGTANGEPCPDTWQHALYPRMLAQYFRQKGLQIYDQTMALDILQAKDGSVAGVVALNTVDGEGILIRCKAVVHAMGNACWSIGWGTAGAKTSAGKECTGDGIAMLMRRGIPWTGLEFQMPYWRNIYPDSVAYNQGVGVGGNERTWALTNAKGEHFYTDSELWQDWPTWPTYWKLAFKERYEGRVTERLGCYYDITGLEEGQNCMRFSRRIPENMRRGMGYETKNPCEVGIDLWDTQELPRMNNTTFEVQGMPGCFVAKASWAAFLASSAGGHIAGGGAAEFAGKVDERKAIDFEEVQRILNNAYAALENEPVQGEGIRANTMQHKIQRLVYDKIAFNRSENGLEEAIAELERMKREDFPNMIVYDKSTHANYEWRQAIEVQSMWIYARAFAEAAITRKETRDTHARLDYKDMDNSNWFKQIYVSMDQSGSFTHTIEDVDDSIISVEEMKGSIVQEVGIGDYPQPGKERINVAKVGHG